MSKKHLRMCEIALYESKKSTITFQHGAVITKGNKIIFKGHNHERSLVKGKLTYCLHSEMVVVNDWLKMCCKNISDPNIIKRKGKKFTIYITRNNNDNTNNNFSFSKPCFMCTQLLKKCNFKRIIYTTGDNNIFRVVKPSHLDDGVLTSVDKQNLKNIQMFRQINNLIHC